MPKNSQNISGAVFAVAALTLSACTVGPNYHRPVVQTPTDFHGTSESPQMRAQTESIADLPWWDVFHDPQLQEQIRTALKQNYDLQLAVERVTAARAQVGIVRSNQFPQLSLNPEFSGAKTDQGIKSNNFFTRGRCRFSGGPVRQIPACNRSGASSTPGDGRRPVGCDHDSGKRRRER